MKNWQKLALGLISSFVLFVVFVGIEVEPVHAQELNTDVNAQYVIPENAEGIEDVFIEAEGLENLDEWTGHNEATFNFARLEEGGGTGRQELQFDVRNSRACPVAGSNCRIVVYVESELDTGTLFTRNFGQDSRHGKPFPIDNAGELAQLMSDSEGSIGDDSEESGDEEDPTCQAGVMGWLICGATNSLQTIIQKFATGVVAPFLETQPVERLQTDEAGNIVRDDSNNPIETPLYSVWSNILTISNVLLVLIFFVFIFSQSLSLNIDAYTIKKALPRLFIAAIGMQLSFYISGFLVDISNVLGAGVIGIMNAAVGSEHIALGRTEAALGSIGAVGAGTIGAVSLAVTTISGAILIPLILLLLGIVAAFLALVFRQVFITLLIVLSPIAFVLWILPNTEKFFKMWWENFIKVLLMYPLIMLLLTSGGLLSMVTLASSPTGSTTTDAMIAIVVIAAPLFLIPATFKMAGAGMAAAFGGLSKLKKTTEGAALGDPKDPSSFRARHGRRVAANKGQMQTGQRGKLTQIASKPTTALPGRFGEAAQSSALTGFYMSASNESKAMEQEGINKDAVLQQAIHRGGGSEDELNSYIKDLEQGSDSDKEKAEYIKSSKSQIRPYIGRDSARIASARNLIEAKQIEHEDMDAIKDYAKTPELAGSLVNEVKYGMRDSRLDMFGYKYNGKSKEVEYDINEAARGLREADPEQIVSQKPRAFTNLQDVGNSEMADHIPQNNWDELEPFNNDAIDYALYEADKEAETLPGMTSAANERQASNKVRETFADAMKSAKGSDAATRRILSDYTEEPRPWDVNLTQTAGTGMEVRPGEEGTVPVSPRNQGGGGGGGNQPAPPVPPPPGGGQQNPQRGGGGNPQPGQPQQGPPPGRQNPQGGNPPQGGGGNAAGGGGNPQPQNPPNRGVPQPPPPQQQGQPQPPPQPQQPAQQNQPQQGPTLPGEQQRSSGLYVPGQDTTGGGTTPEPENEREEGDQGYL